MKYNYTKIFKESGNEKIFGFKKEKDQSVKFYLPNLLFEGVKNESVFKKLRIYIQLLIKYKNEKQKEKNKFKKSNINENYLQEMNNLFSYILLIEDYENNPEFFIFKKINSKNIKNINWKKTIDKNDLFFINKKPFYNTYYSKSKIKDIDHEFYQLYQDNLNNAFELFLGYKIFQDKEKRKHSENYKIEKAIINNFLNNSFKDRDIQIAKILKNIYDSKSESSFSNENLSFFDNTEEINMVWEHMINEVVKLNTIEQDIKDYTRNIGCFKLTDKAKKSGLFNNEEKRGLAIEIDHIKVFERSNKILILDSKFYSTYRKMKNFSKNCQHKNKETCSKCLQDILEDFNSASINKQETYKRVIQKKEKYKNFDVRNIFVMPKIEKFDLEPIHFADHRLNENKDNPIYSRNEDYLIHCVALDFNEVINLYLKDEEYKSFIKLLKEIY